ncbi:MAG: hypothetical protein LZF61_03500 [Nitrosomonas sp.]|nr:MAG: hypothetical protein LZF61_03500 [Nitrosomonas sp.]
MLEPAVTTSINHWLHSHQWARDRLSYYSGKTVCCKVFPVISLMLIIDQKGEIQPARANGDTDVTLTIPLIAFSRLWAHENKVFDLIAVQGDREVAAVLISIAKQFDATAFFSHQTSYLIGDIAAHRAQRTGNDLLHWHNATINRITQIMTEYLVEEQNYLTKNPSLQQFAGQLQNLRHRTEQLEQRLERLIATPSFNPSRN